jgi:hypothetical protein
MRCHHCHAKWSLCDGFGPGGNAAPGYYSIAALVLALIAFAIAYFFYSLYGIILAALLGFMALALFVMAICSCGIQKPATAYQGSQCPKCGRNSWIWPWNF